MVKELDRVRFRFTLARKDRQKRLNVARMPIEHHEFDHALAIDVQELPLVVLDANPQGNGVLGVTKSGGENRRKLAVAAATTFARGHSGGGGDWYNLQAAKDVIQPNEAISAANGIVNRVDTETREIAVEKLDVEYNGRLTGNGQFRKLLREADFERRQIEKEGVIFDLSTQKDRFAYAAQ